MDRIVVDASSPRLEELAAQIPRASTLAPGTRVMVFGSPRRGWLGKMLARDDAPVHVLCSALLARGYAKIEAGREDGRECAWGESPGATPA